MLTPPFPGWRASLVQGSCLWCEPVEVTVYSSNKVALGHLWVCAPVSTGCDLVTRKAIFWARQQTDLEWAPAQGRGGGNRFGYDAGGSASTFEGGGAFRRGLGKRILRPVGGPRDPRACANLLQCFAVTSSGSIRVRTASPLTLPPAAMGWVLGNESFLSFPSLCRCRKSRPLRCSHSPSCRLV